MGRLGGIQVLVLEKSGHFKARAEGHNLGAVHVVPPVQVEVISWPSSGAEFHTQRRRARKAFIDMHCVLVSSEVMAKCAFV